MKNNGCCKLEEGDLQLLLYCIPSNYVANYNNVFANYNNQHSNISYRRSLLLLLPSTQPSVGGNFNCYNANRKYSIQQLQSYCIQSILNLYCRLQILLPSIQQSMGVGNKSTLLNQMYSYFGDFSQSRLPHVTRLDLGSVAIMFTLLYYLLLFLYSCQIPNTKHHTTISSIVSPNPNSSSRTQSFIMANYSAITKYSYKFSKQPCYPSFHKTLNNTYFEPFEPAFANIIFTDANTTTVANNVSTVIKTVIIDKILLSSQADLIIVTPIANYMHLFGFLNYLFKIF